MDIANNAMEGLGSGPVLFAVTKLVGLVAVVSLGITTAVTYIADHER
jgi:hypothetical protein